MSPRDFWVEDEAHYAEVLREMVEDGEWIVPHLNGRFYPDKPPIYFWYLSLGGGILLLIHAIHKADPVFILGQASGTVIYIRNLMLIHTEKKSQMQPATN